MKVDRIGTSELAANVQNDKVGKGVRGNSSFDAILEEACQSPEAVAMDCDEALLAFTGISPVALSIPKAGAPGESESAVARKMGGILTKWENLTTGLAEGKATLKNAEQVVRRLSEECQSLSQDLEGLEEGHPLRKIGEEMRVLSEVELVKLRRGDYL